MSSKKVEDVHTELIKKLLTDSGVVCERSPHLSEESIEEEQEEEEGLEEEIEPREEHFEVEHYHIPEEAEAEQFSDVFPTPSLRRFLPERIRRIEAYNRIKVLPEVFLTEIDPEEIPRINYTAPQVYIDKLATITGCKQYKSSLPEYWFLDTLANLLRRAQEDEFDKPTQAVLIQWFCEWMKEMQHFDAANRDRMMRRWRDNMLAAAKVIAEDEIFPTPEDAGVYYKAKDIKEATRAGSISKVALDSKSRKSIFKPEIVVPLVVVEPRPFTYECALNDLIKIIHYVYDLFATDYQYDLVRSIFTFGPEYRLIHGPFQIEVPKRILGVLKPKKEVKAKSPKEKQDKDKKGPKKKEQETEEYLALMQLINLSNKEDLEREEQDRELWNRRNSILPLTLAATPDFFEMYWPTPAPPSPPPTPKGPPPPPAPKKKGKK